VAINRKTAKTRVLAVPLGRADEVIECSHISVFGTFRISRDVRSSVAFGG
jgi:hypothetical protein